MFRTYLSFLLRFLIFLKSLYTLWRLGFSRIRTGSALKQICVLRGIAQVAPLEIAEDYWAMPTTSFASPKDWIGGDIEMSTSVLRKVMAHLERGDDMRVLATIGATRYTLAGQCKDDHGRTMPDGTLLSVAISDSVTKEE